MVVFQLFEGVSSDRSHLIRQSYSGQEKNRVAYLRIEDEKDETEKNYVSFYEMNLIVAE